MASDTGRGQKNRALTDHQARLVAVVMADPDVELWRAGQLAGFCSSMPDDPEPTGARRKALASSASRALKTPHVAAELDRLRRATLVKLQSSTPTASRTAEARARQDRLDRVLEEQAIVDHGAVLLDLKLRASLADIGDFCHWSDGALVVKDSDALTPAQRQLIAEVKFSPICGKCGAAHETPGVTLKLVDKVRMTAQASKQIGVDAPKQVEVSGRGGGPLQVEVRGIEMATILGVRFAIIGRPVLAAGS